MSGAQETSVGGLARVSLGVVFNMSLAVGAAFRWWKGNCDAGSSENLQLLLLEMIALTLQLVAFFHLLTPSGAAAAEPYDKEQLQVGCIEPRPR